MFFFVSSTKFLLPFSPSKGLDCNIISAYTADFLYAHVCCNRLLVLAGLSLLLLFILALMMMIMLSMMMMYFFLFVRLTRMENC
jgi:hypothetical protein